MQKMEALAMITVYIFPRFGHYCSDLYAGSFMAYLRQPVGHQEGVPGGGVDGLGRLEQRSSGPGTWGIDALASCVAALEDP
jgi:hypothetical protein